MTMNFKRKRTVLLQNGDTVGTQVKHLLILLSFLLLSFLLFGQETGVLYLYETSSGKKWETFGNSKVQPKYKGEIKNGKPNGFGFQTYKNGNKYFGEHKNGLPNGQGRSIYPLCYNVAFFVVPFSVPGFTILIFPYQLSIR